MSNRIEPPVLLSRLLTFVFATSVVVLIAMIVTITKMFPLVRPQVFIMNSLPHQDLEVQVQDLSPDSANIEPYKRYFIMEYIKARNEILVNDKQLMRKKWGNDNGIVRQWSTDSVFADFTETSMWSALMRAMPDFEFECPVNFPQSGAISKYSGNDTYQVTFNYYCSSNTSGQSTPKVYTIVVRLEMDSDRKLKWSDRQNNPIGMRIAEYQVKGDGIDPLDTFAGWQ